MNQKVVIYFIISAILLYLYYKRGDLAIFAAFAVVAGATLIFRSATIGEEGFGFGGGGGGKGCAKMGFTAPKIDKKNIKGSLDKILKNFKKVVEKYVDVGRGFDIGKSGEEFRAIIEMGSAKDILRKWQEDKTNNLSELLDHSFRLFDPYIFTPSEEQQQKFIDGKLSELVKNKEVKKIINGGNRFAKTLEDIKKLDETKELDKKAKAFLDAFICALKQSVLIWKSLDKAMGSGGGDDKGDDKDDDEGGEGDEDEKPKKKKKKSTKKKSKKDDNDDDDDE
jgi:hypothetical protein